MGDNAGELISFNAFHLRLPLQQKYEKGSYGYRSVSMPFISGYHCNWKMNSVCIFKCIVSMPFISGYHCNSILKRQIPKKQSGFNAFHLRLPLQPGVMATNVSQVKLFQCLSSQATTATAATRRRSMTVYSGFNAFHLRLPLQRCNYNQFFRLSQCFNAFHLRLPLQHGKRLQKRICKHQFQCLSSQATTATEEACKVVEDQHGFNAFHLRLPLQRRTGWIFRTAWEAFQCLSSQATTATEYMRMLIYKNLCFNAFHLRLPLQQSLSEPLILQGFQRSFLRWIYFGSTFVFQKLLLQEKSQLYLLKNLDFTRFLRNYAGFLGIQLSKQIVRRKKHRIFNAFWAFIIKLFVLQCKFSAITDNSNSSSANLSITQSSVPFNYFFFR